MGECFDKLSNHHRARDEERSRQCRNIQNKKMTQDERWNNRYEEVKAFIETNKRNPSKHRIEEHDMLNWVKQQRKLQNAGTLKLERIERFKELMELIEENKRVNQYK